MYLVTVLIILSERAYRIVDVVPAQPLAFKFLSGVLLLHLQILKVVKFSLGNEFLSVSNFLVEEYVITLIELERWGVEMQFQIRFYVKMILVLRLQLHQYLNSFHLVEFLLILKFLDSTYRFLALQEHNRLYLVEGLRHNLRRVFQDVSVLFLFLLYRLLPSVLLKSA